MCTEVVIRIRKIFQAIYPKRLNSQPPLSGFLPSHLAAAATIIIITFSKILVVMTLTKLCIYVFKYVRIQ